MTPSPQQVRKDQTLVIWDFDWTVVNCNSDEYVPAYFLGVDVVDERFHDLFSAGVDWHSCVEIQMKDAADRFDDDEAYRNAVLEAAACMPYLEGVRRVMEELSSSFSSSAANDYGGEDNSTGSQRHVIKQAVVSDGNDLFIKSFLEENKMLNLLSAGIVSNSAAFVSGDEDKSDENNPDQNESTTSLSPPAIKVVPVFGAAKSRFPDPHQCKRCPSNLCKSGVLQHLLSTRYNTDNDNTSSNRPRIVYIGDGGNDACPALEILNQNDFLFARNGSVPDADPKRWKGKQSDETYVEHELSNNNDDARHRRFRLVPTLEKVETAEGKKTKAIVYTWYNGKDLYDLVSKHILQQS